MASQGTRQRGAAAAALQTDSRGPGEAAACPAKSKQTDRHIHQTGGTGTLTVRASPGGTQTLRLGCPSVVGQGGI